MNWIIAASVLALVLLATENRWRRNHVEMPTIRRQPRPYDYTKEAA